MAEIDTVSMGIDFLTNHTVDLILSDIELLDGNSFEIYSEVPLSCPIIFTTAYDRFWMDAFDGNGIAYLLKPFSESHFQKAWDKFMMLRTQPTETDALLGSITKIIAQNFDKKTFKKRFAVNNRKGTYFLDTVNIVFFEAGEGAIFAYDTAGKKHLLSASTLKEIEQQLDPLDFFRLNRSVLIHKLSIESIAPYNKNTLAIAVKGYQKHLITSQNTTAQFRIWIEQ